jgi:hypothetical protein
MLKIAAKHVLGSTPRTYVFLDPDRTYQKRSELLSHMKIAAIEFLDQVFMEYDLPSVPVFIVNQIKGFYNASNINYVEQSGIVIVTSSIRTSSGHKIDLEIPLPFSKGSFIKPSVILIEGKQTVLSQEMLKDTIVQYDHVDPKSMSPFGPGGPNIRHDPINKKDIFDTPEDPSGWMSQTRDDY